MGRSPYELDEQQGRSPMLWLCVPGVVAVNEDPERQHRIKATIPSIDDGKLHDEWIRQMGGFAGSGGYGNFDIPKIGSPIVIFGEGGQGKNLYYLCVYNEENDVPEDFQDETVRGLRTDGDFKLIVGGNLQISANKIVMESESSIIGTAPSAISWRDKK